MDTNKDSVGVIVARFQVPELHRGHRWLIHEVSKRHEEVMIALGVRTGVRSKLYPLTFGERERMLHQAFPHLGLAIVPIHDHPLSNAQWSHTLDALIREYFPGRSAMLYGARASFIPKYSGSFPTHELTSPFLETGTEYRSKLTFPHTRDARATIIYEVEHRYPIISTTTDLAVIDRTNDSVLLIGKNHHDGLLSFAGGYAEKGDGSAIAAAAREGAEELRGVAFGPLRYIDTVIIDDPRDRGTPDGKMTTFFYAEYRKGTPSPGDDADSVHWVHRNELDRVLVPWHRPLGKLLNEHWPKLDTL